MFNFPEITNRLLDTGRLGRKNFKGFYKYDPNGLELGVDSSIYSELDLASPHNPLNHEDCVQRCIFQMVNEASRALLEDRVVESAEELDLAMIMGIGFPPFRGGLLRYADSHGVPQIVDTLNKYASQWGDRFKPSLALVKMVQEERGFYT